MGKISVIIPAYNEEKSISLVIQDIPKVVDHIIVVNNNSSDNTANVALEAGAVVLEEPRKGYGYACLKGIEYLKNNAPETHIVVFMDGDYADYPEQLPEITAPIIKDDIDLVIGSRVYRSKESMTLQQVFGNWLATRLMRFIFNAKFTDLGPFRAIKFNKLLEMNMEDKTYGWTIEMQLKALKMGMNYTEIPVKYRDRIGNSKVSGTLKGSVMAGYKILLWIFKYSF